MSWDHPLQVSIALLLLSGALHAQLAPSSKVSPADQQAAEMLKRRLPELRFDGVEFGDVIDFLRDVTAANIFVNWNSLEAAGISRKTPVTARMRDVEFAKALDIILRQISDKKPRVSYTIEEGVITISTVEFIRQSSVRTRVYDVRDIIEFNTASTTQPAEQHRIGDETADQLVQLITETVDPESWRDNGGTLGAARYLSGQLIVTQAADNHKGVDQLLGQLRERFGTRISVELCFVQLKPEQLPQNVREKLEVKDKPDEAPAPSLTGAEVDEIVNIAASHKQAMLAAPRVILFSGRASSVKVATLEQFLSGYTVIKVEGQPTRFEPQTATIEAGIQAEIEATADQLLQNIRLDLKPTATELNGFDSIPWPGASDAKDLMIQRPKLRVSKMNFLLDIPAGRALLVPAWKSGNGDNTVYIIARPSIFQPKPLVDGNPPEEK